MKRRLHRVPRRQARGIMICLVLVILLAGVRGTPGGAQEGGRNSRSNSGNADQGFTVAGTISGITEDAPLFVSIVDRAAWDASGEELQNPDTLDGYVQGIRLNPDGAAELRYEFTKVPPGTYAIRAFLDTNRNDNLDIGIFGPKEPWAIYQAPRRMLTPPRFDPVSFELSASRDQVDMELR
jgi:hypothetical protein